MLLMPLAHRPVRQATPDLSAYALPDGSVPPLCAPGLDRGRSPNSRSIAVCDACLLTAAPGLVVAGLSLTPPSTLPPARLGTAHEAKRFEQRYVTAARPRAPPSQLA